MNEFEGFEGFKEYVQKPVDKEAQEKRRLSEIEELILKPHQQGIGSLTQEEINKYIELTVEELRKIPEINNIIISVFEETQKIIKENKDTLLKSLESKEYTPSEEKGEQDEGREI